MFLIRCKIINPDYTKRNANELNKFTTKNVEEKHLSLEDKVYSLLNDRASKGDYSLRLFDNELPDELIYKLKSDGFEINSHKINDVLVHDISW